MIGKISTACEDRESCRMATLAADDAARKAVERTFFILGVDIHNPKEVEEFRKSLRFGDYMRKAADKGFLAFAVIVSGALAGIIWAGIVQKIKG